MVRFMILLSTRLMMKSMIGGNVLSKYDIEQMTDGQREIYFAGVVGERERIIKLLMQGEMCEGKSWHIIEDACKCEIIALIKGGNK